MCFISLNRRDYTKCFMRGGDVQAFYSWNHCKLIVYREFLIQDCRGDSPKQTSRQNIRRPFGPSRVEVQLEGPLKLIKVQKQDWYLTIVKLYRWTHWNIFSICYISKYMTQMYSFWVFEWDDNLKYGRSWTQNMACPKSQILAEFLSDRAPRRETFVLGVANRGSVYRVSGTS